MKAKKNKQKRARLLIMPGAYRVISDVAAVRGVADAAALVKASHRKSMGSQIAQAHPPQRGCLPQVSHNYVAMAGPCAVFCSIGDPQHAQDRFLVTPP